MQHPARTEQPLYKTTPQIFYREPPKRALHTERSSRHHPPPPPPPIPHPQLKPATRNNLAMRHRASVSREPHKRDFLCSEWGQCLTRRAGVGTTGNVILSVVYNLIQGLVVNRAQVLCEGRGGRPGISVLMSLTDSADVKQY